MLRFDIEVDPRHEVRYRNARNRNWEGYKTSLQDNLRKSFTSIKERKLIGFAVDLIIPAIISAYYENYPLKVKNTTEEPLDGTVTQTN